MNFSIHGWIPFPCQAYPMCRPIFFHLPIRRRVAKEVIGRSHDHHTNEYSYLLAVCQTELHHRFRQKSSTWFMCQFELRFIALNEVFRVRSACKISSGVVYFVIYITVRRPALWICALHDSSIAVTSQEVCVSSFIVLTYYLGARFGDWYDNFPTNLNLDF